MKVLSYISTRNHDQNKKHDSISRKWGSRSLHGM